MNDNDVMTLIHDSAAPQMSLDPASVVTGGRRRRTHRRMTIAGLTATALVAIGAASVGLNGYANQSSYRPAGRVGVNLQKSGVPTANGAGSMYDNTTGVATFEVSTPMAYLKVEETSGTLQLRPVSGNNTPGTPLPTVATVPIGGRVVRDASGNFYTIQPLPQLPGSVQTAKGGLAESLVLRGPSGKYYAVIATEKVKDAGSIIWTDAQAQPHLSSGETATKVAVASGETVWAYPHTRVWILQATGSQVPLFLPPQTLEEGSTFSGYSGAYPAQFAVASIGSHSIVATTADRSKRATITTAQIPGTHLEVVVARISTPSPSGIDSSSNPLPAVTITWTGADGRHYSTTHR